MRLEIGGLLSILGIFAIAGAIETNVNPVPAIAITMLGVYLFGKEVLHEAEVQKRRKDRRKNNGSVLDFSDFHDASYPSCIRRRSGK